MFAVWITILKIADFFISLCFYSLFGHVCRFYFGYGTCGVELSSRVELSHIIFILWWLSITYFRSFAVFSTTAYFLFRKSVNRSVYVCKIKLMLKRMWKERAATVAVTVKDIADDNDSKGVESTEASFLSRRVEQNGMGITRSLSEAEPGGIRSLRPSLVSRQVVFISSVIFIIDPVLWSYLQTYRYMSIIVNCWSRDTRAGAKCGSAKVQMFKCVRCRSWCEWKGHRNHNLNGNRPMWTRYRHRVFDIMYFDLKSWISRISTT